MAWCMERTSDDDLSFNLDSELAKASDSVSTPGRKSFGLQKHGKTVGGKDLKRTEKKAVRNGAQAGAQELGSYDKSCGVVAWQPRAMTKVSSGRLGRGGRGAARSATGGHQHQRQQQQQQRPTPQRIGEKKQSPLAGRFDNKKGAAKIIPGSSLGGFRAVGAAGIASRGAASLRTRYDIQKTRENAKEKVEQAAQEKQVKDSSRWGDISTSDGGGGVSGRKTQPDPARRISAGKPMKCASDDVESPPKRRKVGDRTPQTSAPSPPELVTVEDSSSDEAPQEKEEGKGEGGNAIHEDARAGGEGERREKDNEWCKQSSVTDGRSCDGERGGEKEGGVSTGATSTFGTIPEFGADAVMIGSHVVASLCHMKINMGGRVTIALKIDDEDAKDTTLDIPEGDITFFGFSNGDKRSSKPFVAIRTRAKGKVASDPYFSRKYDPEDKGAAGLITIFLREERTFEEHVETIEDVLVNNRGGKIHDGMDVNFDMKGELPSILRSTLEKHRAAEADEEEALGGVRTRRTLRSGTENEDAGRLLLYYPPESSAGDRVAVTVVDEARTQEGEFLNDSLIDLCLKHMHREALPSWEPRANGGQIMDGERIHILTSHFFTKLSETKLQNFAVAYSKVKQWSRNVDLFSKKFVFVPVVENMHWSLACLTNLDKIEVGKSGSDFKSNEERPCMLFLDSLGMHQPTRIYGYLRRYLEEKWKEAGNGNIALHGETFPLVQPNAPTQINGCDCGVYILRYAKEICQQWPLVTSAHVKDKLARFFVPELFGPKDIVDERRKLRELLGECKVRYEKEKQLRQQRKLFRCKDKSKAKDKDEGDRVEAEDGKRDTGVKPAPSPEPASGTSRHGTPATVEIATKVSASLVSTPAPALNQAFSAAHDLAGVEGREGLVEPARGATAAAAVIVSTAFSCVQTPGEAGVHAGEETSSLSREGAACDRGKEEEASDSIDNDSNNRCNAATTAARRRRQTLETKKMPGGGAKNDGGGDGDGVEEAAGEGAASSAPSRGETDEVARGGSGRTFNGMKAARRRKTATGKENADRLATAGAGDAVGSGIASRNNSSSSNNSVDDNVKEDREGTCSSTLLRRLVSVRGGSWIRASWK
ncbi:unnamed protein product [Ascophyllum nodosum]